jgi:cobalt/nickel transport system permease protein
MRKHVSRPALGTVIDTVARFGGSCYRGETVHIPDGFLTTQVWATLDITAAASAGVVVRRAQRSFDDARIPLLGVMGAFVFAAQMINFPVAAGTTSHLVGGALLAYTLGPAAASVVMTAILAIQALIFQDGGVLALGANAMNMAVLGVLAAYLPYHLWGNGPRRGSAIFAGGMLSVLVSALAALSELLLSGVRMPGAVLGISLGVFVISAVLEGAITLTVVQALEHIQPGYVRQPSSGRSFALGAIGLMAVLLATVGTLFASANPDGLERLAERIGIASRETVLVAAPMPDYHAPWMGKAGAGLAGILLIFAVCQLIGRFVARRRGA